MKIAWIGTGVMGAPMASHLARAGYEVKAYNRTYSKAKALEPLITACSTIEEAVKDAEIVFSIVGFPKDVEEVSGEIMKHVAKNTLLVDMTTSSPDLAQTIYSKAKSLGLRSLDAPVTGGDVGAIQAKLSIMVGGDEADFLFVKPLLEKLGTAINYMGPAGFGQTMKLANQTIIAANLAGFAEGLNFAKEKGLPIDAFMAVINGGSASSWQGQNNGPKMINHDYAPGFYIKHFLKDLNLVHEAHANFDMDVVETVRQMYQILVDKGYENDGTQAIIEYYTSSKK